MSVSFIGSRTDAPQDARQIRSRNALCGAMLELLEETSFDQITIREISARAGTGYATFFRHYPTKEALLGDIASDEISTLLAMTASMLDGPDRFASILDLVNYVDAHRKLWGALLTGGAAGMVRDELIRQTKEREEHRKLPEWLPPELAQRIGVSSSIDIIVWWLEQKEYHSPDQIAVILDRLVLSPIIDWMVVDPARVSD